MITPNSFAAAQYYKVGDYITFAWNYTNIKDSPTAINIVASNTQVSEPFTLASNYTVKGHTGKVVWDSNQYKGHPTQQLLTGTYTLIIFDADTSISATPVAGKLEMWNDFQFGMYTPQEYTPWTGEFTSNLSR